MNVEACGKFELDASMELEDVFLHFFTKFRGLENPRSVAEARISSEEVDLLQRWFSRQYEKPKVWCERTWQEKVDDDIKASSREMLGALFLILASETYRDEGSEDSAWATIAEAFKANRKTQALLFANQHPSELCKLALAAGVQKLKLRNLIESDGKQEYFDTLKLQVGFTFKGVARRLPEWLDGFGCTTAIRILNGVNDDASLSDLPSNSFQALWKALREYRRGLRSQVSMSAVLASSPWVRSGWVPEILDVATLRIQRSAAISKPSSEPSDEPLCEPILQWGIHQARPALFVRLNEDRMREVLAGRDSAVFAIDGSVVGRWMARADGGFNGERQMVCKGLEGLPNLRPQCLTISSNGEPVETVDFADLNLMAPFLLFDLSTSVLVDPNDKLDPTRDYALVCDTDLKISGIHPWRTKTRLAYRLDHPFTTEIALTCAGAVLWKPRLDDLQRRRIICIHIESVSGSLVPIGTSVGLIIRDAPEDARAVKLLVGDRTIPLFRSSAGWEIERPFAINLPVAMRSERLRVLVEGPDYKQTVIPKLSLQLRGVAILKPSGDVPGGERWHSLRNSCLNRASGDGKAKIFHTDNFTLYEGFSKADMGRGATVNLRDLNGWGHPLIAHSECDEPEVALVESVEDRGCIDMYLPAGFGNEVPTIRLRIPILPTSGHAVLMWEEIGTTPRTFSSHEITAGNDGFTWNLPKCEAVVIAAVVYEGICLGAWWSQDHILASFLKPLTAETVALMRWLKIPILSTAYTAALKPALANAPIEFLRGWLAPASLRPGLKNRLTEDKLDTVVRALFWNYSERRPRHLYQMVEALGSRLPKEFSRSPIDNLRKTLLLIGEICPSFAHNLARANALDSRYRECIRNVAQDALQSDSYAAEPTSVDLNTATNACARLLSISPGELLDNVNTYATHLDGNGPSPQRDTSLRRLGETGRGRHYLTAALLTNCLERVTPT